MAPQRTRKRKSTASASSDSNMHNATVPAFVPTNTASPPRSPAKSPTKRTTAITQAQKQALIDNLQLEITERARKLRAQYMLQAHGLRTRLEFRVNRIPAALRKTTIAELLERYSEKTSLDAVMAMGVQKNSVTVTSHTTRPSPLKPGLVTIQGPYPRGVPPAAIVTRGTKRTSAAMDADAEKENAPAAVTNPKKRVRTAATGSTSDDKPQPPATRLAPPQILSPRSNNSRTLPQSPFKAPPQASPFKSYIARPVSPLKPSVTVATASSLAKTTTATAAKSRGKPAGTRALSRQVAAMPIAAAANRPKRGAAVAAAAAVVAATDSVALSSEQDGRTSSMSDASAGTTVVTSSTTATTTRNKRAVAALPTVKEKAKRGGLVGKIAGMGSRGKKVAAAAAKLERDAVAAAGEGVKSGRVLRKRG